MKHATDSDVALAEQRVENRRALARVQWAQLTASTQATIAGVQRVVTHPLVLGAIAAAGVFAGRRAGNARRKKVRTSRGASRAKAGGLIASLLASAAPMLMRHGMALAQEMLLKRRSGRRESRGAAGANGKGADGADSRALREREHAR
jgi:hypothetical protein